MNERILMIEDEPGLVLSVGDRLCADGYNFSSANDGKAGFDRAATERFDLVLVDLMLPGKSGFDIVRDLRGSGNTVPIIVLTARSQVVDRVSGLRMGADDYLCKPFAMDELVARIEARLRSPRGGPPDQPAPSAPTASAAAPSADGTFRFGPFELDYRRASLSRDGAAVQLTHQEYRLLCVLIENEGRVIGADELLDRAWGYTAEVTSRTLYVHIAWLRKKLAVPENPSGYIRTLRRIGYLFQS